MSLLAKVRNRLAHSRRGVIALRDVARDKQDRAALAEIIAGIERLMDAADEKLTDPRANASKVGWREKEDQQQQ